MDATIPILAAAALAGAVLIPGLGVAGLVVPGRDALARLAVAAAAGRLLFAAAGLVAFSSTGAGGLWIFAGVSAGLGVALLFRRARARRSRGEQPARPSHAGWLAAGCAVAAGALLLVVAVVARSGLGDGALVFFGRDGAVDPLVYASYALRLEHYGLPFRNPFAGDAAVTGSSVPFAVLAGLHALGIPVLDAALRALPFFDAATLALTALALLRSAGAAPLPAALAALLLLLGGGSSAWLAWLAGAIGVPAQVPTPWLYFGPHLLGFNPIAAGLQTWLAALLLLVVPGPRPRAAAVLAGVLVAGLFEIKLFLWAPALGGLALLAAFAAPAGSVRRLREAAATATLLSLPFVFVTWLGARGLAGRDETGLQLCAGCMPRWLLRASFGAYESSSDLFDFFRLSDLLDPRHLAAAAAGALLMASFGLGARLLLLPEWLRMARGGDAGRALLARAVLASGALGFAAACLLGVEPHEANGLQFVWAGSFAGWLAAAFALPRWWQQRRLLALGVFPLLLAPGSFDALGPRGLLAPASFAVSAAERELIAEIARHTKPGDVVLEPSMLRSMSVPSALPWLANRPVYLSLFSAIQHLPEAERVRRHEHLLALFLEHDETRALEALEASRARFVLVPAGWPPLHDEVMARLQPLITSSAGALYRVGEEAGVGR